MSINITRYIIYFRWLRTPLMRPPVYSSSLSIHKLYNAVNNTLPIIREWKKSVPFLRPCYAVSDASSRETISILRENRVPMICDNARQVSFVNDYSLVIEGRRRLGTNEYIARNVKDIGAPALASPRAPALASPRAPASPPLWIHTSISSEGIETTREMFEYIWAHKFILNGIVFNTHNFADKNAAIPPPMYSYKVALEYLFRNVIVPFKQEYGIHTPCIMMDGRDHITRVEHLHELRHSAFDCKISSSSSVLQLSKDSGIELRLIVDSLLDRSSEAV